jgi:hypothetical protein
MRPLLLGLVIAATAGGCSAAATEVAHREPLPSYGREVISQRMGYDVEGRRRFWAAYQAGQPAEFTSTRPSVEGDPVTTIYRVLGPGRVEVFVDATHDRFGSGRWEKYACKGLRKVEGSDVDPDFSGDATCVEVGHS